MVSAEALKAEKLFSVRNYVTVVTEEQVLV